jgi:hypothetical protein
VVTGVLAVAFPRLTGADQIVVSGTTHAGVKIVGFEEGRLQFRTAKGLLQTAWIEQVDSLTVDRGGLFADLNEAERYAVKGEGENALIRYRRAARMSEDFWTPLIEARHLHACDAPSLVDQAAASFIRLMKQPGAGPLVAARLIPRGLPSGRSPKVAQALNALDTAAAEGVAEAERVVIHMFRYEILRRFRGKGDTQEPAAMDSHPIALWLVPETARCERVYSIQLSALSEVMADGTELQELRALNAVIRDCPESVLPSGLLLKGEALLAGASTPAELIRASWPFLRVAIHMPDDARAAEGLLGAARVLQRLGQPEKAVELLGECLDHRLVSGETRKRAEAALASLGASGRNGH